MNRITVATKRNQVRRSYTFCRIMVISPPSPAHRTDLQTHLKTRKQQLAKPNTNHQPHTITHTQIEVPVNHMLHRPVVVVLRTLALPRCDGLFRYLPSCSHLCGFRPRPLEVLDCLESGNLLSLGTGRGELGGGGRVGLMSRGAGAVVCAVGVCVG